MSQCHPVMPVVGAIMPLYPTSQHSGEKDIVKIKNEKGETGFERMSVNNIEISPIIIKHKAYSNQFTPRSNLSVQNDLNLLGGR